jgi:phytoene synthase
VRADLLALLAFNVEIARIADSVSEPQLGLIRQQWWLDTLDAIEQGDAVDHPVAAALAATVAAYRLPVEPLRQLVIAREADLHGAPMGDLDALEAYLGATSSVLIQLSALILAGSSASSCAEAAGLAGVAHGLATGLAHPRRRPMLLPPAMDLGALIAHARQRLDDARRASRTMPRQALPAFLPASLTELYLDWLARDPDVPAQPSQFRRQLTMWWRARQDRF